MNRKIGQFLHGGPSVLAFVVVLVGTAAYAATPDTGNGAFVVAQNPMNPRNDPDVQKGVQDQQQQMREREYERAVQARQRRIDECVHHNEASLSPVDLLNRHNEIVRGCANSEPMVPAVRG